MRTSVVFIGTLVGAAAFVPRAHLPVRGFAPTALSSTINEAEAGDAPADERAAGLDPTRLAERRNAIAAKRAASDADDDETTTLLGEDEATALYAATWSAEEPVAEEATPDPEPILAEPPVAEATPEPEPAPVVAEEPAVEEAPAIVAAVEQALPKVDPSPSGAAAAATPPMTRTHPHWAGRFAGRTDSLMVPPVMRAPLLDGTHAGDGGFDPLGLAIDDARLFEYQKAEVKHGRLAMLGIVGWLAAENHPLLPGLLASGGRVPTVLNGGLLDSPGPLYAVLCFFAHVGAAELAWGEASPPADKRATTIGALHHADLGGDRAVWGYGVAGDYGFDPAGFYSKLGTSGPNKVKYCAGAGELAPAAAERRLRWRSAELANGRAAMVGIVFAALFEATTGSPATSFAVPAAVVGTAAGAAAYASSSAEQKAAAKFW